MPFVQRVVDPIYLSRKSLRNEGGGSFVTDDELDAVANNTLSNVLRQLASIVSYANDIFENLSHELQDINKRTQKLGVRITVVEEKVTKYDPRRVPVPESDISSFSSLKNHFSSQQRISTGLFTSATRPENVQKLYEAAAKTPVHIMRQMDRYRHDGHRSSKYFICTPVLDSKRYRINTKIDIDIETRKPAVLEELRQWTSVEALGDVTVTPDCASRIVTTNILDISEDTADGTDYRLPSPEEQVKVVARQFPPELIRVDTSGRAFQRMCVFRRSLINFESDENDAVHRRSRNRKMKNKRRNTIASTSQKELEEAISGETEKADQGTGLSDPKSPDSGSIRRSLSNNPIHSKDIFLIDEKKSHFASLKHWSKIRFKMVRSNSSEKTSVNPKDANIYETVTPKNKKVDLKNNKKYTLGSATPSAVSTATGSTNLGVRLRESSILKWSRKGESCKDERIHSSSGNWSASSESGRASVTSETTSTTPHPKSTTTLSSAGTSSNSLSHHQAPSSSSSRRIFLTASASSSFSEGTLTPDIMPDICSSGMDDGETSSVYSCDTEGYYTSFHMDSGLKTLKEEDIALPQVPLHSTSALSSSLNKSSSLTAESEYELFGKGSTSTTTSSAGTVCTTLLIGNGNNSNFSSSQEVSDLSVAAETSEDQETNKERNNQIVTALVHKEHIDKIPDSPDSGHNTPSSPYELANSPHGTLTGRSSEYDFSESDLEGIERIERIKTKTTINSSQIPLLCVITPPQSDDENNTTQSKSPNKFTNSSYKFTTPVITEKNKSICQSSASHVSEDRSQNKCIVQQHPVQIHDTKCQTMKASCLVSQSNNTACDCQLWETAKLDVSKDCELMKKKTSPLSEKTVHLDQTRNSFQPLNAVFSKVKDVITGRDNKKSEKTYQKSIEEATSQNSGSLDYEDRYIHKLISDKNYGVAAVKNKPPNYMTKPSNGSKENIEYVSLNEIPSSVTSVNPLLSLTDSSEIKKRQGARVTLDSEGKVIYSSDSLRRMKGMHSTFEPGPYVKQAVTVSNVDSSSSPEVNIHPDHFVISKSPSPSPSRNVISPVASHRRSLSPKSPQLGKVIIRAGNRSKSLPRDGISSPPLVSAAKFPIRPLSPRKSGYPTQGAYVNMQTSNLENVKSYSGSSYSASPKPSKNDDKSAVPASSKVAPFYSQHSRAQLLTKVNEFSNVQVKRSDSYKMANKSDLSLVNTNKRLVLQGTEGRAMHNINKLDDKHIQSKSKIVEEISNKEKEHTKTVTNPNLLGRKFYGAQVKMDPSFFNRNSTKLSAKPHVMSDVDGKECAQKRAGFVEAEHFLQDETIRNSSRHDYTFLPEFQSVYANDHRLSLVRSELNTHSEMNRAILPGDDTSQTRVYRSQNFKLLFPTVSRSNKRHCYPIETHIPIVPYKNINGSPSSTEANDETYYRQFISDTRKKDSLQNFSSSTPIKTKDMTCYNDSQISDTEEKRYNQNKSIDCVNISDVVIDQLQCTPDLKEVNVCVSDQDLIMKNEVPLISNKMSRSVTQLSHQNKNIGSDEIYNYTNERDFKNVPYSVSEESRHTGNGNSHTDKRNAFKNLLLKHRTKFPITLKNRNNISAVEQLCNSKGAVRAETVNRKHNDIYRARVNCLQSSHMMKKVHFLPRSTEVFPAIPEDISEKENSTTIFDRTSESNLSSALNIKHDGITYARMPIDNKNSVHSYVLNKQKCVESPTASEKSFTNKYQKHQSSNLNSIPTPTIVSPLYHRRHLSEIQSLNPTEQNINGSPQRNNDIFISTKGKDFNRHDYILYKKIQDRISPQTTNSYSRSLSSPQDQEMLNLDTQNKAALAAKRSFLNWNYSPKNTQCTTLETAL